MTPEKVQKLMPILQAFAAGKEIEYKFQRGGWATIENPEFRDYPEKYRIKSAPKRRPFANSEECLAEMSRHADFGWILNTKTIAGTGHYQLVAVDEDGIVFDKVKHTMSFADAFEEFAFLDGTPFGIVAE